MDKNNRLYVVRGITDQRQATPQKVLWTSRKTPLCVQKLKDRRVDEDTRRVLDHMLAKTRDCTIGGTVMAAIRRDGRIDIVVTGCAFDDEVMAAGAVACLQAAVHEAGSEFVDEC